MSFPTDKFSKVSIEQIVDNRINTTRYYRNKARGNQSPYFMISLTTSPIQYTEYMELSAIVESYEGALENFTLDNPLPPLASFTDQDVHATANAGAKSVLITGNRAFKVGDYVQFSNHTKVYRIATVSQSSNTTIGLTCPLIEQITSSHTMKYGENVSFQVCLNNTFSTDVDANQSKYGVIDVELVEQA